MDEFIVFMVGLILILAIGFGTGYEYGHSSAVNHDFTSWTALCHRDGGQLQLTSVSNDGSSQNYECYKNGKIIDHMD